MGKKKDYDQKVPGQQYEEIEAAQRKLGRDKIGNIQRSKDADKRALKHLGEEALERFRKRKKQVERRNDD
jgi:hypothetical protein